MLRLVRGLAVLALAWVPALSVAAPAGGLPHLELDVRLDPASRQFQASVKLTGLAGPLAFDLDPALKLEQVTVDGRRQPAPPRAATGSNRYRLAARQSLALVYGGRLAPLPAADHRQVLGALPAFADADGSYLPAGSGWYPDPGRPFTYRLRLALPAGQKGLVPGTLARESDTPQGYRASFDFPHPAEGIPLMAGPYQVTEQTLDLEGRSVRLRTWFHGELADQAQAYLADAGRYLQMYDRQIGPYPFAGFSVVSSPLPTGFGMPGLTYLGRQVLRLPFIRATSLGHEVLHNWWGNGVYPDWARGNWSEGLTTFLADYAYKEAESADAARQMRLGWLRDLAAMPESEDTALAAFTSRQHGLASIVGYNKSAMVFLMLRDRIGREAFDQGLRLFWQRHRFRTAGWDDLARAFSQASGQDLTDYFRQWVDRPGAPRLKLVQAQDGGGRVGVEVAQQGDYRLRVPLDLLIYPGKRESHVLEVAGPRTQVAFPAQGLVQAVDLDPDYRLWRRVEADRFPPILREIFVAPRPHLIVADPDPAVAQAARSLAGRLTDVVPREVVAGADRLPDGATLIIGTDTKGLLQRLGLAARPVNLAGKGSAQVWAGRDDAGRPYAVITGRNAQALAALERALPHYGGQSWLLFDGGRVVDKGIWPPLSERLRVMRPDRLASPGP